MCYWVGSCSCLLSMMSYIALAHEGLCLSETKAQSHFSPLNCKSATELATGLATELPNSTPPCSPKYWDTLPLCGNVQNLGSGLTSRGRGRIGTGPKSLLRTTEKISASPTLKIEYRLNHNISCLFVVWHEVRLELPLGPVLGEVVVGDLRQVEVGHLGGGALHPAAGRELRVGLALALKGLLLLLLLRLEHLGRSRDVNMICLHSVSVTAIC